MHAINISLLKDFFVEVVKTTCYLISRCPTTSVGLKTPKEVWSGTPSKYHVLKIFVFPNYAHMKASMKPILIGTHVM